MRKTHWKKPASVAMSAMLLVLAACSSGGNSAQNSASPAASSASPSASAPASQAAKDPWGPLPEKTTVNIFKVEPEGGPDFLALPQGETITDNRYIKAIDEKFNLDVKFPVVVKGDAAGAEKGRLMIASNDISDVMIVGYKDYLQMIDNDMLADITDAYNDYASPQLKEVLQTDEGKALQLATVDGKLYGIPTMGTTHNSDPLIWLRKDWMDKLGLQAPKTVDDLVTILQAFKDKDPDGDKKNDTIGLPGVDKFVKTSADGAPAFYSYDAIFSAFKSYTGTWVKGSDGTIQYGSIQPQTKDALSKLSEMYKDGVIPKDFAIMKHEQASEKVVSGQAGAFFGPWWAGWDPLNAMIKNDPTADWRAYALQNSDGKSTSLQEMPIGSIAVVKKGFKYPEAMVKMVNYGYAVQLDDPETAGGDPYKGLTMPNWQTLPVPMALWRADSVILDHNGILAASKGEELPKVGAATLQNYKTQGEYWAKGVDWLRKNPDFYGEPISRIYGVDPIIENNIEPVYSEYYGVTRTMEQKMTNLDKLEIDSFIKIITGEKPIEYFDEFVSQWKKLGGDQITKEVNDAVK
ncbi:extracellular solute-binding protein [Cohnella candidum]|uniref:Extracellular solute-binding protein n=1 Tax=Cohnella candidum TaxID=2674991 RepID=A0A3G3JVU4_9BACL|nr:extracellular solute-binding protein [Cohnella candidum]AYQ72352.1 extracellular solute-binding protein [Cohnella candidum]